MSQARFVPGHKNIWRCKGTRKMCKWQTEIIQPKTEHSTAAATESDMNYSVLQAHRTEFFPGEGGRDDLPPNHISKTNVLTFLISHDISAVSPRPSVITRKTCDFHCRSCVIIFSLQETISILFAHLTIYFCSPSSPSIVWNTDTLAKWKERYCQEAQLNINGFTKNEGNLRYHQSPNVPDKSFWISTSGSSLYSLLFLLLLQIALHYMECQHQVHRTAAQEDTFPCLLNPPECI